jgi:hypothetical protein
MPPAPIKWKLHHVCILVFAISFFAIAMHPEAELFGFTVPTGGEVVRVARSLADHGTFANPFQSMNTGVTAHVAPVYPFIYAALVKVFGTGYPGLLILWGVNIAFFALQLAVMPWLTSRLGLGITPGLIAAALGSVSLHTTVDASWECFLAGLMLMLAFILTWRTENWSSIPRAAMLGIAWGIFVLTNPLMVLLLVAWPIVVIASRPRAEWRKLSVRAAAMFCAVALTIAPWIARNYIQFGSFIFVRDNLGLELSVGNNPCASPTLKQTEKSGCLYAYHPNSNPNVAKIVADSGELAFERTRLRQALDWINSNRAAFLKLSAQRFREFWFPSMFRRWEDYIVWPITLLSVAGIFALWRKNPLFARLILATWTLFPVIYYFVPAETRYTYPIYWTVLLPAGYALSELFAARFANRFAPASVRADLQRPAPSDTIR